MSLRGRGGHASEPESTRDSVLAESAATVTPDDAELAATVRVGDAEARDHVFELIEQIAAATAAAHDVTTTVERTPRHGATVNHPGPAAGLRGRLAAELGGGWARHAGRTPVMAAEDFSYHLQRIPGAFAPIGGAMPGADPAPLHSARYGPHRPGRSRPHRPGWRPTTPWWFERERVSTYPTRRMTR
ncbi:hypothetical protein GCM10023147_18870 [Tsukamurella soli]|uniref:Uncharacterized protein n=1 Tax=Tsukamurella soli TaxID=644556 RepID=A0ABP8JH78_9ACTN